MLTASVVWVMLSDRAFQDAAEAAADRRSKWQDARASQQYRAAARAWVLAPTGRSETAFAWKSATQTFRSIDVRLVLRFGAILVGLTIAAMAVGRNSSVVAIAGAFAAGGAVLWILLAPQAVRLDLRADLEHLELLKTWPVPSEAVVRGELLWPVALITTVAWTMAAFAIALSGISFPQFHLGTRLAVGAAALIVMPTLALAQLTIHNAAALFFPAWVPLGTQRSRASTRWGSG